MKIKLESFINRIVAFVTLMFLSPLIVLLYVLLKLDSPGQFIFKQRRLGKNKKPFTIFKIRTMVVEAEKQQKQLLAYNEADGPVFKIRNDPRYTRFGQFISYTGLDEVLQLINVIKGEMNLVGPRPLPVQEAVKIPVRYKARFAINPGMTSLWVVRGTHQLSFKQWMEFDLEYLDRKSVV